jgi:hypothetical protein
MESATLAVVASNPEETLTRSEALDTTEVTTEITEGETEVVFEERSASVEATDVENDDSMSRPDPATYCKPRNGLTIACI